MISRLPNQKQRSLIKKELNSQKPKKKNLGDLKAQVEEAHTQSNKPKQEN
jgi:hypothetical protein